MHDAYRKVFGEPALPGLRPAQSDQISYDQLRALTAPSEEERRQVANRLAQQGDLPPTVSTQLASDIVWSPGLTEEDRNTIVQAYAMACDALEPEITPAIAVQIETEVRRAAAERATTQDKSHARRSSVPFWSSTFGKTVRWLGLVLAVAFLSRFVEIPSLLLAGWFFSSDPPNWAVALGLLFGGGVVLYLIGLGAALFTGLVSSISPKPRVGLAWVGVTYVGLQILNGVTLVGEMPWWVILNKAAVTLVVAIMFAVSFSDQEA